MPLLQLSLGLSLPVWVMKKGQRGNKTIKDRISKACWDGSHLHPHAGMWRQQELKASLGYTRPLLNKRNERQKERKMGGGERRETDECVITSLT